MLNKVHFVDSRHPWKRLFIEGSANNINAGGTSAGHFSNATLRSISAPHAMSPFHANAILYQTATSSTLLSLVTLRSALLLEEFLELAHVESVCSE